MNEPDELWRCPNCAYTATSPAGGTSPYHGCPKRRGRTITLERVDG